MEISKIITTIKYAYEKRENFIITVHGDISTGNDSTLLETIGNATPIVINPTKHVSLNSFIEEIKNKSGDCAEYIELCSDLRDERLFKRLSTCIDIYNAIDEEMTIDDNNRL